MLNFIKIKLIWIVATIFLILAWATWATAGSITQTPLDPVVIAPAKPVHSWNGPYAGGAIAYQETRTRVRVTETTIVGPECDNEYGLCDPVVSDEIFQIINDGGLLPWRQPGDGNCGVGGPNPFSCITGPNELWLTNPLEVPTGSHTERRTTSEITAGVFAGYGREVGPMVVRGELGAYRGFDSGNFLVTAETQLGFNAGRALPYISGGYGMLDGDGGYVIGGGVDFAITPKVFGGVFGKGFKGTTSKLFGARVGFKF